MLSQTKKLIKSFFHKEIIQLSPPRSGSTLLWNCLCMYNYYNPRKIHSLKDLDKHIFNTKLFITVRNPLDIVCSLLNINEMEYTQENIKFCTEKLYSYDLNLYIRLKKKSNCHFFKYEEFFNNYEIIFTKLDQLFGEISPSKKSNFNKNFAVDNVFKKHSLNKSFSYCDKKTNLHGRHISENKGVPNFHLSVLKKSEQEEIKKKFHEFMLTFNYT